MKKNFFFLILGSCLAMATACGGQEAAPDKDLDMNSSGIQEQEPSGKQEESSAAQRQAEEILQVTGWEEAWSPRFAEAREAGGRTAEPFRALPLCLLF